MMMKVQANDYVMAEKVLNALEYGVPQFRERVFMVGIHKGLYQNEPNTLIFEWDKHSLFDTEDVLTRAWPKEREFMVNSPYAFPAKGILKKLTVEYWFNKNDVENHPNGKDIFQVKRGREKMKLSQKAIQVASHLNDYTVGDTLQQLHMGTTKCIFILIRNGVYLLRKRWLFNLYQKNLSYYQLFRSQESLK